MGGTKKKRRGTKPKVTKKILQKHVLAAFSLDELISKTQDEINIFQYKEAQTFCQEALKREPDNLRALEISACLCIETENFEGAKHCLGRAITLAPENGFSKYLSMGQLLEGNDSLQCYLKGIELINVLITESSKENSIPVSNSKLENRKDVDESKSIGNNKNISEENKSGGSDSDLLLRKLSNAHCAVAELFMSDLCDEEDAETNSLLNIEKAISIDSENPEAYQHYANFLLIKQEIDKAKENIKKSVSLWLPKYEEVEKGTASAGSFDPVDVCPLTQSSRFQVVRILIEVEEYQLAADILEGLLGEDDEVIYTWYLYGWNYYLQGEKHAFFAKQHFEKAMELHKACPTQDESIIEHMKDLLIELKDVQDDEEDCEVDDEDCEVDDEDCEDLEELEREINEMEVS